ncbi:hypothetical protein QR680_011588 [Steinernema hermaphroditum]|uniref:Uncharacterized protein n=1 Tax=Steinernema hermaphroditum TaxID=289476 RepID=A0AA39HYZ9_9BILA|nr:hypothetical protein QR680_011588 [Steinernema hermaphroditum]
MWCNRAARLTKPKELDDAEVIDKVLAIEAAHSREWLKNGSILSRRTAEIFRDSPQFKHWAATVPNDMARLPYDIVKDVLAQGTIDCLQDLTHISGPWSQAAGSVKITKIYHGQLVEVTPEGEHERPLNLDADSHLCFKETTLNTVDFTDYVDLAPRMFEKLSITGSYGVPEELEGVSEEVLRAVEEVFFNALGSNFSSVFLSWTDGPYPCHVQAFLLRAIYGRHLRKLWIRLESEDSLKPLEHFLKKENFEMLTVASELPYPFAEFVLALWRSKTFFPTAKQKIAFKISEATFKEAMEKFFDWNESQGFFGDSYFWRKEMHPSGEDRIAEITLIKKPGFEETLFEVNIVLEEGTEDDLENWNVPNAGGGVSYDESDFDDD